MEITPTPTSTSPEEAHYLKRYAETVGALREVIKKNPLPSGKGLNEWTLTRHMEAVANLAEWNEMSNFYEEVNQGVEKMGFAVQRERAPDFVSEYMRRMLRPWSLQTLHQILEAEVKPAVLLKQIKYLVDAFSLEEVRFSKVWFQFL